jgi:hypothetical protein
MRWIEELQCLQVEMESAVRFFRHQEQVVFAARVLSRLSHLMYSTTILSTVLSYRPAY